jgi:hypothetical protein
VQKADIGADVRLEDAPIADFAACVRSEAADPERAPCQTNPEVSSSDAPRDDVAAMLAARQELGPDYEQAVIDSFVARISQTIDQRVESRLAEARPPEVRADASRPTSSRDNSQLILGIVSMGLAVPLTGIAAGVVGLPGLIVCWAGIAVVNLAHAAYRHERR